jgi:hypothetical protein
MKDSIRLVIFENKSLPQSYKALEVLSEQGLIPLEFYPHANGVRILFQAPEDWNGSVSSGAQIMVVSKKILKAMLGQSSNQLKKLLLVIETTNLADLIKLAIQLEQTSAEILEIRSLRSNPAKNYALITLDDESGAKKFVSGFDHAFLSASSAALKEFLGFVSI